MGWARVRVRVLGNQSDGVDKCASSPESLLKSTPPGYAVCMHTNPAAGRPASASDLVNVPRLVTAYYAQRPDPGVPEQRVSFGTSGHRGSSLDGAFNEWHILAITQAICAYRRHEGIDGPLFLGADTHALAEPAFASALEVLAANEIPVMVSKGQEYTPTPAVSLAILNYNRGRNSGLADGIVITPSHNPPADGGFKYNPPNGGPASSQITSFVQSKANEFLVAGLSGVKRVLFERALRASGTHAHDFVAEYVEDLGNVIDMGVIRSAGLKLGVDPLGGAGVHYWGPVADRYGLNLTVVNDAVDPTFGFMTLDWDGKIRMDPSSPYAMRRLIDLRDKFDIAMACDTDHDRHGIVTKSAGLLPPNHYLSVCIHYLFSNRPKWRKDSAVGKTVVSSSMIDRVAQKLSRRLHEVPVGFKWFVDGLVDGSLGFTGEESAGASFLRLDGTVWTTDKDGLIAALLAAEITSREQRDPGEIYQALTQEFGAPVYDRIDAPATAQQKAALQNLSPEHIRSSSLAGEKIQKILTKAGDGNAIGGVKVIAEGGWFAARPSGTEEIYKIYAESFRDRSHLERIEAEAQAIIGEAFGAASTAA
jgi:phosphoglucomutase